MNILNLEHISKTFGDIYIPALVYDNPFIDKGYIENLERAAPATRNRLLY